LTDINEDAGQKVASEDSSRMKFFKMDVTKAEDWKSTLEFAIKELGKVDILVNNAGWTYRNKVRRF
jgi:NADP-dependent 3-hydroxy acid dehydrogenase YdfG